MLHAPCALRLLVNSMLHALCCMMPAIASLEDLRSAQKDLLEAKDLHQLKAVLEEAKQFAVTDTDTDTDTVSMRSGAELGGKIFVS